jgi:hypothetical protein
MPEGDVKTERRDSIVEVLEKEVEVLKKNRKPRLVTTLAASSCRSSRNLGRGSMTCESGVSWSAALMMSNSFS